MNASSTDSTRFSDAAGDAAHGGRKRKLGKGLGALMGETRREEPLAPRGSDLEKGVAGPDDSASPLRMVPVAAIAPLPGNPRRHFDDDALEELAASIAKRGVIQPIIVRRREQDADGTQYQLVAGERRWRAAQKARLHEIPALVRDLDEREVLAIALIENLQREDLNPIEEARAYKRLAEEQDMTQADIAAMVEKSRSHIANTQRLLALPAPVLTLIESGKLSMGHARALIGHDDAAHLAEIAVSEGLSVRDVEQLVREPSEFAAEAPARQPQLRPTDPDIVAVQNHLEEILGLKVQIKTGKDARSGAVTIRYGTLDQLDMVCQRLTGGDI